MISPLLANVFLHYVFDLWVNQWRKRHARGSMIMVRYADDFVMGFQDRDDAERFLRELRKRFAQFGLQLHPDKTRLIEFGRFAAERREKRGEGRPETFNFLGFTHCCGKTQEGSVHDQAQIDRQAACGPSCKRSKCSCTNACTGGGRGRPMAAFRGPRVVQLPCRPRKHRLSRRSFVPRSSAVAAHPAEAEPERAQLDLGADSPFDRGVGFPSPRFYILIPTSD